MQSVFSKKQLSCPLNIPSRLLLLSSHWNILYVICVQHRKPLVKLKSYTSWSTNYMFFLLNFVLITLAANLKKTHVYRCFLNFACYLYFYTFMIWILHKACLVILSCMVFHIGFHFCWFKRWILSTIVLQLGNWLVCLPTSTV